MWCSHMNSIVALLTFYYNCLAQLLVCLKLQKRVKCLCLHCHLTLPFLTKCRTGIGRISACGGDGFAGGGGGRVSVDIFSRHDEPEIFVYGKAKFILHVSIVEPREPSFGELTSSCFWILCCTWSIKQLFLHSNYSFSRFMPDLFFG